MHVNMYVAQHAEPTTLTHVMDNVLGGSTITVSQTLNLIRNSISQRPESPITPNREFSKTEKALDEPRNPKKQKALNRKQLEPAACLRALHAKT